MKNLSTASSASTFIDGPARPLSLTLKLCHADIESALSCLDAARRALSSQTHADPNATRQRTDLDRLKLGCDELLIFAEVEALKLHA